MVRGVIPLAVKQTRQRDELVTCEYCGERYSAVYRSCPFCEDIDDRSDGEQRGGRGGKRLTTNTRGGGYGRGWTPLRLIAAILSVAVIIAAGCIIFSVIKPFLPREIGTSVPTPPPATPSATTPVESDAPTPTPTPTPTPPPTPSTAVGGFTLNKSDFTLSRRGETYRIRASFIGGVGEVELWQSSDPSVATVSQDGTVTAVSRGTCTVTAMAGGIRQKCIVRCNLPSSGETIPTPKPPEESTESGTAELNRTDFTLGRPGERFRLKVTGNTGEPVWSSSSDTVISLSGDGTVTALAEGTCTVTAKVDGQTLKCIVRVKFN